jgi:hypothetical protein
MEYSLEALDCPNCGAPLNVKPGDEITFCEYCNSSIRIKTHADTGEHQTEHTEIPPELLNEIKQLILSGKKAEAVEIYQKEAGVDKEVAEKIVESIVGRITIKIILNRPLSAKGIMICILFIVLSVSMVYLLVSGKANDKAANVICWLILFFSLVNLLSLWRAIIATIKYLPDKWHKAVILKYVLINKKKNLSFYKVLLEVRDSGGQSFRAESSIMLKAENVANLQEGKTIDVIYKKNDRSNIIASAQNL